MAAVEENIDALQYVNLDKKPIELTMEQLTKLLGYEVKIIK